MHLAYSFYALLSRLPPRSPLPDRSMNSVDFVEKEIESQNVVVFSKSYCP